MGKASTITCKANLREATVTGDWVQGELVDLTITGVTFAADGTFLLALLYAGDDDIQASTASDGSTALAITGDDLSGVLNLNTTEIAAQFSDTSREYLDFWLQLIDTTNSKTYVLRKMRIWRSYYLTGMGTATDGDATYLTTSEAAATYATIAGLGALATLDTVGENEIDNEAVTRAKLTQMQAAGFLGASAAGAVTDLTADQATAIIALADATTKGLLAPADYVKLSYLTVTQAVDLDAIETRVNQLDAAVVLKGGWDASAGTFPGAGAAQAGWSYQVTVAGTVDGVDFSVNDRLIALTDNASTDTYAANWLKADYSDLVASVAGLTGAIGAAALTAALNAATTGLQGMMSAADKTKLDTVQALGVVAAGTLSGTTTWSPDLASGNMHTATAGASADITVAAPTNGQAGQVITFKITNGGAANSWSWNASYKFAGGEPSWTESGPDQVAFQYDGTNWSESGLDVQ